MKLVLVIFFSPDLSISRIEKDKIFLKEFCLRFAKFQGFASLFTFLHRAGFGVGFGTSWRHTAPTCFSSKKLIIIYKAVNLHSLVGIPECLYLHNPTYVPVIS